MIKNTSKKLKKMLILGASSDIGLTFLKKIDTSKFIIGAHCFQGKSRIEKFIKNNNIKNNFFILKKNLNNQNNCHKLVKEYLKLIGSIDILIQLNGNVSKVNEWKKLKEKDWKNDIAVNVGAPFFVAQKIFNKMKKNGGKIILMSTASAKHGGGNSTMAYGIAKAGVEALTKGLAREGVNYNILVNAIAPGLISTRFHKEKLNRTTLEIKKRLKISKLGRMGKPSEIAKIIEYLVSDDVNYITGEIISISGGDWI